MGRGGTVHRLRLGQAEVDFRERRIRGPRGDLSLTPQESALLAHLAERRGVTVDRSELLSRVLGYAKGSSSRAVDQTVSRLRRKLEPDPDGPRWLVATRGGGYRLELPSDDPTALPDEPSAFVGREDALARLADALATHRVVALVGLGGMGKTRL